MILLNGIYYSDFSEVPKEIVSSFIDNPSLSVSIRYGSSKIYFWEEHYFQLVSLMRISRMDIPLDFTPDFLSKSIKKIISDFHDIKKSYLISIKVSKSEQITKKLIIPKSNYLIEVIKTGSIFHNKEKYSMDVYNDFKISLSSFNNIEFSFIISLSKIFSFENNLDDSIILDNNNNVVRSAFGEVFCISNNDIKTPKTTKFHGDSVYKYEFIKYLKSLNKYNIIEKSFSPFEIVKSEELFIVSVRNGFQSVTSFKKKKFVFHKTSLIYEKFKSFIN